MYNGKLVKLRPLEMDDIDVLMKYINELETRQYLGSLLPFSRLAETRWLEGATTDDPWKDGRLALAIEEKKTNEFLGTTSLFDISKPHRHAEFGIALWNPSGRNKGFGTDATLVMLWVGFHVLGLNNIYLQALEHNKRAIRTYEKAGFKHVGVLREVLYSMGSFQNAVVMDILRNEFLQQYPPSKTISDE